MKKDDDKELVKLTAQKLLLGILKLGTPFFHASHTYRSSTTSLITGIDCAQQELSDKINYLRDMGYIKTFSEQKEKYLILTDKGLTRISQIQKQNALRINRPEKWDGEWWIVVWDIPKDKSDRRDCFRRALCRIGFIKIQESVYVYPFECTEIVDHLISEYGIDRYVSVFAARAIRKEEEIIKQFIDAKTLNKSDLK